MLIKRKCLRSLIVLVCLITNCTIIPFENNKPAEVNKNQFDEVSYVDQIWKEKIVPAVLEYAIPLTNLLDELNTDQELAVSNYGTSQAIAGKYSFMAFGEGLVLSEEKGLFVLDIGSDRGSQKIFINLGPAFTSMALRDSVGFIKYDEFLTIMEFAAVGNEINSRVREMVVSKIDKDTIIGKNLSFYGAFTLNDIEEIILIPIKVEVINNDES